jgi:hypothetical protein
VFEAVAEGRPMSSLFFQRSRFGSLIATGFHGPIRNAVMAKGEIQ